MTAAAGAKSCAPGVMMLVLLLLVLAAAPAIADIREGNIRSDGVCGMYSRQVASCADSVHGASIFSKPLECCKTAKEKDCLCSLSRQVRAKEVFYLDPAKIIEYSERLKVAKPVLDVVCPGMVATNCLF
ncbi:hypothetical protein ACP70R_012039 [Stipagrostis hirtigluma subsp. patula]